MPKMIIRVWMSRNFNQVFIKIFILININQVGPFVEERKEHN